MYPHFLKRFGDLSIIYVPYSALRLHYERLTNFTFDKEEKKLS